MKKHEELSGNQVQRAMDAVYELLSLSANLHGETEWLDKR
jgi:hypothetical protein